MSGSTSNASNGTIVKRAHRARKLPGEGLKDFARRTAAECFDSHKGRCAAKWLHAK